MTCSEYNLSRLRDKGFRLTPQRLSILQILHASEDHLTPTEIYHQARKITPGMTEATVYRTLSFLSEQGLALEAHVGSGQLVYEIAERDHHHLICRKCGKSPEIEHAMLQALYQELQKKTGFLIDSTHMTFFGLCSKCQENNNPDRFPGG
ncbi:MAG: Fur family transcriptional regulator [Anaerolineales bacterium]